MSKALSGSSVVSYALDWFNFLAGMGSSKTINMPKKYRRQVMATKELFNNDVSGLVTTIVDFMIKSATVNYKIETKNSNLDEILNDWAWELNSDFSTYIPTGLKSLAKQYFIERWKGSSHLLLRVGWGKVGDMELPTQMVFVAGEDIITERRTDKVHTIDNVKYSLRIDAKNSMPLPAGEDETIYVRRPYESWDTDEPTPFMIKRGVYYNIEFMKLLLDKSSFIVDKAMKYIFHVIQGSEAMEIAGIDTYSKEDLEATKDKIKGVDGQSSTSGGTPVLATNWDTTLKHMIPDYELVVKQSLFTAMTQRILNGLGVLEIEQSARKEDYLNPKPMISEIESAMKDFSALIEDVLREVKKRNEKLHPKYFRHVAMNVWVPPVLKDFLTKDLLDHFRSAYDRGDLSKETYATIFDVDWQVELSRRGREVEQGIDDLMFPHPTQNTEGTDTQQSEQPSEDIDVTEDKKGPEKKNYKSEVDRQRQLLAAEALREREESPYRTESELPKSVKALPKGGQQLWLNTFNAAFKKYSNEDKARQLAWDIAKRKYKKDKDGNWVNKK